MATAIILMSCKKEQECVTDSGEVTFWMDQATAARIGSSEKKMLAYYINDDYKVKSGSNYFMLKAPACGEYYEGVVHLPANCGDTYKVEDLVSNETLFSGKITMGENNCLVLQLK